MKKIIAHTSGERKRSSSSDNRKMWEEVSKVFGMTWLNLSDGKENCGVYAQEYGHVKETAPNIEFVCVPAVFPAGELRKIGKER